MSSSPCSSIRWAVQTHCRVLTVAVLSGLWHFCHSHGHQELHGLFCRWGHLWELCSCFWLQHAGFVLSGKSGWITKSRKGNVPSGAISVDSSLHSKCKASTSRNAFCCGSPLQGQSGIPTPHGWHLRWSLGWSFLGGSLWMHWLWAAHLSYHPWHVCRQECAQDGDAQPWTCELGGIAKRWFNVCLDLVFLYKKENLPAVISSSQCVQQLMLLWLADAWIGCICWYVLNLNPFDKSMSVKIFKESFLRSRIISLSQMNRIRVTFAGYYFFLLYYHQSENKSALLLLFLFLINYQVHRNISEVFFSIFPFLFCIHFGFLPTCLAKALDDDYCWMYWTLKSVQASQICIWIKINIYFGNSDKKQIVLHNLVFFSFCICDCFAMSGWDQSFILYSFSRPSTYCYVLFSIFFPTMGPSCCKPSSQEACHHFPILAFWHSL